MLAWKLRLTNDDLCSIPGSWAQCSGRSERSEAVIRAAQARSLEEIVRTGKSFIRTNPLEWYNYGAFAFLRGHGAHP